MFSGSIGHLDMHKFPHQKPSAADLTVWVAALCRISSKFYFLMAPLCECINSRHTMTPWRLSLDGNEPAMERNIMDGIPQVWPISDWS
jgi:hypothetical protein